MQFFDIHTHFPPSTAEVFTIRTVIAGREEPPALGTFSIGVHPWYPCEIEEVTKYASDPRCVAIGECGLDSLSTTPMAQQISLFQEQIELSEEIKKPLIIHCVRMYEQVLRLRQMHAPHQRWVMHGFRKGPQLAQQLLEGGIDLSFGAALVSAGPALKKTLELVHMNRLFLETDNQNTITIHEVYHAAARIRNCTVEELVNAIRQNVKEVFKITP
jgi:TatD DNase family protein